MASTVTVALVTVPELLDAVCLMAIVSPLLKPANVVQLQSVPLRMMSVQPAPHVAVLLLKPPVSVTALLVMLALVVTPYWAVKLKGLTVLQLALTKLMKAEPPLPP